MRCGHEEEGDVLQGSPGERVKHSADRDPTHRVALSRHPRQGRSDIAASGGWSKHTKARKRDGTPEEPVTAGRSMRMRVTLWAWIDSKCDS